MNILLLGGSGVIGSGINNILCKKYNVTILNSRTYNRNKNKYHFDKKIKFDTFIHAAGVTDEEINHYGRESSIKRSSEALKKLLNQLALNNCKNFVYISSQRVYLNFYRTNKAIFNETRSKVKSTTVYEKCHLLSENIFKKISKRKNFRSLIIRPGVVYGIPKNHKKISRPKLIQHAFLNSLIQGNDIKIQSSGKQYRNFSLNEDVGKIIFNWMNIESNKKFTISNTKGKIITVKNYAQRCSREYEKLTSKKSRIIILGKNKSQFKRFKIYQQIKFKTNIDKNLKKFIQTYLKIGLKKGNKL